MQCKEKEVLHIKTGRKLGHDIISYLNREYYVMTVVKNIENKNISTHTSYKSICKFKKAVF